MKHLIMILFAVGMAGFSCGAQETKTNAPATPLSPQERAQYDSLSQTEIGLNAQLKLLQELTVEHSQNLEDAGRTATPEWTKWENDLIQEFRSRSSVLLGQLNDTTKQRLAMEAAHSPIPAIGIGALDEGKNYNAHEYAYLHALDERLLKVRQELAASDEGAKDLYSELQTNTTAEAVTRVSSLLDENTRQAKQWEREETDLELRRLEFQALRK